jgi:hypothetical protein
MTATRWEAMKNPAARTKGDPKYQVREPDGWPVALVWQERDLSLVAAAPDLLAACRALVETFELADLGDEPEDGEYGDGKRALLAGLAAIAKATGQ